MKKLTLEQRTQIEKEIAEKLAMLIVDDNMVMLAEDIYDYCYSDEEKLQYGLHDVRPFGYLKDNTKNIMNEAVSLQAKILEKGLQNYLN